MIWNDKDYEWHKWFAWFPVSLKVCVEDLPKYAWLETVDRKMTHGLLRADYWEYKDPKDTRLH